MRPATKKPNKEGEEDDGDVDGNGNGDEDDGKIWRQGSAPSTILFKLPFLNNGDLMECHYW